MLYPRCTAATLHVSQTKLSLEHLYEGHSGGKTDGKGLARRFGHNLGNGKVHKRSCNPEYVEEDRLDLRLAYGSF